MSERRATIAIVINTSWNIYNFRIALLKSLQKDGYRIVAIAPYDEYSRKLEALGFEYHNLAINNKGTNPFEDLKLVWTLYRLYGRVNPDVSLHYTIKPNIYGTVAAWLAGVPVISNISGLGTVFLDNSISSRLARFLYKLVLRFPAKVFFQNADDQALFITSKLVEEKSTGLLPGSGINTSIFSPVDEGRASSPLSFLFIARLVKDKGLVEYVDAARMVKKTFPDVQFDILGPLYPGNPTAITAEEIACWQAEGVVNYLGTSSDVPSVIAQSNCIVLPSYREGLSRVLLEAASMAKPIVTTDVPGCRDVVENDVNGFLCNVRDANDLALKMEKMIKLEHSQRVRMGQKGRAKVLAQFDEKTVLERYRSVIRDILSTRH